MYVYTLSIETQGQMMTASDRLECLATEMQFRALRIF